MIVEGNDRNKVLDSNTNIYICYPIDKTRVNYHYSIFFYYCDKYILVLLILSYDEVVPLNPFPLQLSFVGGQGLSFSGDSSVVYVT
jgi:hypothetical protein